MEECRGDPVESAKAYVHVVGDKRFWGKGRGTLRVGTNSEPLIYPFASGMTSFLEEGNIFGFWSVLMTNVA